MCPCCGQTTSEPVNLMMVRLRKKPAIGITNHPDYGLWASMLARCHNPSATSWSYYGGRGIKVCKRWHEFTKFIEDMGARKSKDYSIDRIDFNGDYNPDNCRWVLKDEQNSNTRASVFFTFNGETHTISEWSRITGIPVMTVWRRVKKGIPDELVFKPTKMMNSKRSSFLKE